MAKPGEGHETIYFGTVVIPETQQLFAKASYLSKKKGCVERCWKSINSKIMKPLFGKREDIS